MYLALDAERHRPDVSSAQRSRAGACAAGTAAGAAPAALAGWIVAVCGVVLAGLAPAGGAAHARPAREADPPAGNLGAACRPPPTPSAHAALRPPRAGRRQARSVRRLGDARPVRGHPPGARDRAHRRRACSTSRTWARSRRSGPEAEAFLQHILSNDVTKIAERGAQYSLLCREDGGVLDDLFTYRLGSGAASSPSRTPPTTRRTSPGSSEHAAGFDVDGARRRTRTGRCSPCRARRRAPRSRGVTEGELPARMRTAELRVAGVDALVCGTGYTGEDGCELMLRARTAPARSGTRCWPRASGPPASARATRCASRSASTSTATTSREDRNPIEAGLGWCCKLDTGFIGADALRGFEPEQTLVPFAFTGPGIPRQGNPIRTEHGRGRRDERHRCRPASGSASAWATCRWRRPSRVRASRSTCAASCARPRCARSPSTHKERPVAEASYPDDLKYHPEHDWARIDGDTADVRRDLVRPGRARRGGLLRPARGRRARCTKDETYAEVESVKAVSRRVRAAVRRDRRGQRGARRQPRAASTRIPTARAGWSRSGCRTRRGRPAARRGRVPRVARDGASFVI